MSTIYEPDRPLEFTRNLDGLLQDKVIAALSAPLPKTDPLASYRYLRGRRDTIVEATRQRPLIRMQDKNLAHLAPIELEQSCRFEEIAHDTGEAGVVIRGGNYLGEYVRKLVRIEEDLHLSIDPFRTKPNWRTRWGGKITTINVKRDSSGIHTVELIATAQREHLKTTLVGSTPLFPPEVQPIKMWLLPANIRTGCAVTLFINWLRAFEPIISVPTNIFNPFGWVNPFGPDALLMFDPLQWPMQVAFVNPVFDQSRTSLIAAAWNDFHSATLDPLKDAGCLARVYTWFSEDEDTPHPELELLVGKELASLARPKRNCVVAAFEDRSGVTGPTGTFVDGPINLIATTLDDLITTSIFPFDTDGATTTTTIGVDLPVDLPATLGETITTPGTGDGEIDPLFRKLFLVEPKKPEVGYRDGQHSGIIESSYNQHKGPIKTTMIYGPSPKIVNDLQTFGIRYAISQIAQVVLGVEAAGVEGLDNLYQGQLDNILLPGQRFTNPLRALFTGDLGYLEHREEGGGTAYTISGILGLRIGDWKKRAWRSFKTSVRNAAPHIILQDIPVGERVWFEQDGIIYVDDASAIKYEYDRRTPITWGLSIGDDAHDRDPFAQGVKTLQAIYSIMSAAVGEGWLFS